jgi:hypothetical protein
MSQTKPSRSSSAERDAEADAFIATLVDKGFSADPRIVSAYAGRGLYAKIAEVLTAHAQVFPSDIQARLVLASAWYAAGNPTAAIRELEALKKDYPAASDQADDLIEQIQSGKPL